jgi:hypothetical protein
MPTRGRTRSTKKRASLMWRPLFEQIRSELLEGAEGLCFAPSRESTLRQRVAARSKLRGMSERPQGVKKQTARATSFRTGRQRADR